MGNMTLDAASEVGKIIGKKYHIVRPDSDEWLIQKMAFKRRCPGDEDNVISEKRGTFQLFGGEVCIKNPENQSEWRDLEKVVMHELMHSLGLKHTIYQDDVMYHTNTGRTTLNFNDKNRLVARCAVLPYIKRENKWSEE